MKQGTGLLPHEHSCCSKVGCSAVLSAALPQEISVVPSNVQGQDGGPSAFMVLLPCLPHVHKDTWQPLPSFKVHSQLCQLSQDGSANELKCVKGRMGPSPHWEHRLWFCSKVQSNRETGPGPSSHVEEKWHGWISQHLYISSPFCFFCPLSHWWTDADWH